MLVATTSGRQTGSAWYNGAVPIEFALTPDSRWGIDVAGLAAAAHGAGFSALGIAADRIDADTALIYASAGLRCHEVLAHVLSSDSVETLSLAQRVAQAADAARAEWVLTVVRTRLSDETAKVIQRCAAMFEEVGAGMAVEFTPLGCATSLQAGLEIVAAAAPARAGLLIDSWHFCFGDSTWDDLLTVPLDQIAYVQFADGVPLESDNFLEETLNRRAMPGDGILELDRFASALCQRGWEGLVSVEVLNSQLIQLPVSEFAQRAHDTTVRYWT